MMISADDSTLIDMVRSGRRDAFDEIDRRYRGKLRRLLQRETASAPAADDLTQQVLIKAFQSISTIPEGDTLAAWLSQLALGMAEKYRLKFPLDEPTEQFSRGFPQKLPEPESRGSGPAEILLRQDEATDLWARARKILTADEYTVVCLKYIDDQKVAQIARTLGRSRISVRVLLFRARRKLQPFLENNALLRD